LYTDYDQTIMSLHMRATWHRWYL